MRPLAVLVVSYALVGALAQETDPRIVASLQRSLKGQDGLKYSGERHVELVVGGERKVLIEYVLRSGARSRITYPNDSPRRGFVIVETPQGRWEYDPKRNEIRVSSPKRGDSLRIMGALVRSAQTRRLKVSALEQEMIAGRKASGYAF
ncbi:MAG: hypothetical protein ACR2HJ_07290 [Fimbriimonadales bacterium]